MLAVAFVFSVAGAWRFTPVAPYASLIADEKCDYGFFSPDGATFVTVVEVQGPIRVWDVAGGFERFSLDIGVGGRDTPVFSPDGRLLAARAWNRPLTLWETTTGKEYARFRPTTRKDTQVPFQFSPDGRYLLYHAEDEYGRRSVTFWNVQERRAESSLGGDEEQPVTSTAGLECLFAPDARRFAKFLPRKPISENAPSEVSVWRMPKPQLVKRHRLEARALAVSPDLQSFASIEYPDGKGELALRDMETGKKRWTLPLNEDDSHPDSLWFEAGGKILVARGEEYRFDENQGTFPVMRAAIWDAGLEPRQIATVFRERPGDRGVPAVSPDGKWFAIPLPTGAKLAKVAAPEQGIDLVAEGDFTPQPTFGFRWIDEVYATPEFTADGKLLIVHGLAQPAREPFLGNWLPAWLNPFHGRDQASIVGVWDVESGTEAFSFEDCSVWPSPHGSVIATLTDRHTIELWAVPLRPSVVRILGWAAILWAAVALLCGVFIALRKAQRALKIAASIAKAAPPTPPDVLPKHELQ